MSKKKTTKKTTDWYATFFYTTRAEAKRTLSKSKQYLKFLQRLLKDEQQSSKLKQEYFSWCIKEQEQRVKEQMTKKHNG